MIVSVAWLPRCAVDVERNVCVVIDLLRASNTMVAMLEAGARVIEVADSTDEALRIASGRAGVLACGERDGQCPPGFAMGNSPIAAGATDLSGQWIVYATSNGTAALRAVSSATAVLVGALRNADATIQMALEACRFAEADLVIVCAGDDGTATTSLEDVYCAGLFVDRLIQRFERWTYPEVIDPRDSSTSLALDESAIAAHRVFASYAGVSAAPEEVQAGAWRCFDDARNGRRLRGDRDAPDLAYCAAVDRSSTVPRLMIRDARLIITRAESAPGHRMAQ